MSESQVTVADKEERVKDETVGDKTTDPFTLHGNDISPSNQLWLNLESNPNSTDTSPSPASQGIGLLSLPWEMMVRIASHLPAQCIINVLPKVCRVLGAVGEDVSAWQLRVHRLTGSRTIFPVGSRENFNWPMACLEMEKLIDRWVGQQEWLARERATGEREEEEERQREMEDVEQGGGDELEVEENEGAGAGAGAEEVAGRRPDAALEEWRDEGIDGGGGEENERLPERDEMREEMEFEAAVGDEDRNNREVLDNENEMVRDVMVDVEEERSERTLEHAPPPALEHVTLPAGHIADVNAVLLVGGEGAVCASGSRDRNVNLWDLRSGPRGALLRTLSAQGAFSTHRGWVWSLAASGHLLASGAFDSTVRLWDLAAGGAEKGLIQGRAAILSLSCQTNMLFAGSHDQRVSIYDTRAAEPLVKSLRLHGDAVLCLASDDQYILSGSKDQSVAVFDRRAGKLLKKIQLNSYLLSMSYNEREVWAGDNHGLLHTFSMESGSFRRISQFNVGHTSLVTGIHKSPGTLYTCSSDRTIKVHLPCAPPRTLCTLNHQAGVNGLSVEAGVLAIASGDMNVEVWRPRQ